MCPVGKGNSAACLLAGGWLVTRSFGGSKPRRRGLTLPDTPAVDVDLYGVRGV